MRSAIAAALVVFVVVFAILSFIEWLFHRLRHNPDTSYRWGVWLFAILAGLYIFINNLGH